MGAKDALKEFGVGAVDATVIDSNEASEAFVSFEAERVTSQGIHATTENLASEDPLEIQLCYGMPDNREIRSISVTMRTPGNDPELAVGFLLTEGVLRDVDEIEKVCQFEDDTSKQPGSLKDSVTGLSKNTGVSKNIVRVDLASGVSVPLAQLRRNFYMTSSCGMCGKASLSAIRSVCPPRRQNAFAISSEILFTLPARMQGAQTLFERTGGIHGASLFNTAGDLIALREDVGRHNAVDKLLGRAFLEDRVPLWDTLLLLSGRASFELLQKAVMGGIPMVAAIGAPSSLAVRVAREFDVALIGFLNDKRFNIYHGQNHVIGKDVGSRKGEHETSN